MDEGEVDLFDEFGNYLGDPHEPLQEGQYADGQEHDTDEDDANDEDEDGEAYGEDREGNDEAHGREGGHAIVQYEDKMHYVSAAQLYGHDVETLVQDEDTQLLSEPIIAPLKTVRFQREPLGSASAQELTEEYSLAYLTSLMDHPARVRNVAVVGELHHGKTSLIDLLVAAAGIIPSPSAMTAASGNGAATARHRRGGAECDPMALFMDNLFVEERRRVTLTSKPLTILLPDLQGTSTVLNIMDTPGHADFSDQKAAALRMADGVLLVVDVLEGLRGQARATIRACLAGSLSIVLVVNKMERLFLELRLSPIDAYYKVRNVVDEVNTFIAECIGEEAARAMGVLLAPERGNVIFSSTIGHWAFSLKSFARAFARRSLPHLDGAAVTDLARRLWGDIYYSPLDGSFSAAPSSGSPQGKKRTFVTFILEPIYKVYTHALGEDSRALADVLAEVPGLHFGEAQLMANNKDLIRTIFASLLPGGGAAIAECVREHIQSPEAAAFAHITRHLRDCTPRTMIAGGSSVSAASEEDVRLRAAAVRCSREGPLLAYVCKTFASGDATTFDVLVRVHAGTLSVGSSIRILGESYLPPPQATAAPDQEPSRMGDEGDDCTTATIGALFLAVGRHRIAVQSVPAGSWALIPAIDGSILKTATIIDGPHTAPLNRCRYAFAPLTVPDNKALMKVAIEPVTPAHLPRMLDALRKLCKTYPLLETKVEDSGEHLLVGTGELYMDAVLHDLRNLYADIEVKVSDPVAVFGESVAEESYRKCFAISPNGHNKVTVICEALSGALLEALQGGRLATPSGALDGEELAAVLQEDYGWDVLAARSVIAFGPDPQRGPNVLLDETLPSEVDRAALVAVRDYLVQGFQWACREGPLCEEAVRGVAFKVIDLAIGEHASQRSPSQIIPTVRRVCYSAMLTAAPRIVEPVNVVEIQTTAPYVQAAYECLARRRGHVISDVARGGTPYNLITAYLPLMDSFGFECDLRIHAQGMATCQSRHDHWQVVPGDPLDESLGRIIPLEASPAPLLARDFMIKSRRRKALSEAVSVGKFFDEAMLAEMAREDAIAA